jgi:hypothetical protein
MPSDTTQYGYAYWFRYTTWYPVVQTTGKSDAWYVMSRLTISNPQVDYSNLGDRVLAIWQGQGFYHFTTYDTVTNNYNLQYNVPF